MSTMTEHNFESSAKLCQLSKRCTNDWWYIGKSSHGRHCSALTVFESSQNQYNTVSYVYRNLWQTMIEFTTLLPPSVLLVAREIGRSREGRVVQIISLDCLSNHMVVSSGDVLIEGLNEGSELRMSSVS